jgi:hypothetical protein
MRRVVVTCLVLIGSLFLPISPASATLLQYQQSPADTYNRTDLPAEFNLTDIAFGVSDNYPDEYMFFLDYSKPITASQFADGLGSWGGIFLDIDNDGDADYSLETNSIPYDANYSKQARFIDRRSGTPTEIITCAIKTWTNLEKSANFIGFSIKKICLDFSTTIGVRGFTDFDSGDNGGFDYAPENFWKINLSGGLVTVPGKSSSSTILGELPSSITRGVRTISLPSNPPADLVSLASTTTKSVVTVLCGEGLGSGWSINATLSAANIRNGYKSYIITNNHVISDCTEDRDITLVLADQTRVSAYVYAWDEENDVAGLLTKTVISPLEWRGVPPQQGWWVGIIGSPLGFPGILTTGIVSSIDSDTFLGTTNAAINPGNSGGPVFDRNGRVIGLATAKYVDSEGFGIFHGTPLLCGEIIDCTFQSEVWQGSVVADPSKAAADKAAADKAAADKAIADAAAKAAADKLIADAAAAKAAADKVLAEATARAEKIIADAQAAVDLKIKLEAEAKAVAAKAATDKLLASKIAKAKVGAVCPKINELLKKSNQVLVCAKSGTKLKWKNASSSQTQKYYLKVIADKAAADKVSLDKALADKITADNLIANAKIEAEKILNDAKAKAAADKAAADKAAADKAAADANLRKVCVKGGKCPIGSIGPGGGIVFYDAGSQEDWGRYLEVAPNGWSGGEIDSIESWCSTDYAEFGNTDGGIELGAYGGELIGDGKLNTELIIDGCSSGAAVTAHNYDGGGKNDWYLPSLDELNELCKFARGQELGDTFVSCTSGGTLQDGFLPHVYWSSSSKDGNFGWTQYFDEGDSYFFNEDFTAFVRPIRSF